MNHQTLLKHSLQYIAGSGSTQYYHGHMTNAWATHYNIVIAMP